MTIRSVKDNNAAPCDTAKLAGADDNYLLSGPSAPTHFTIVSNATALAAMRAFIIAHENPPTGTPTPATGTSARPPALRPVSASSAPTTTT